MTDYTFLTVRLEKEFAEQLKKVAREDERSRGAWIRNELKKILARRKRKLKADLQTNRKPR